MPGWPWLNGVDEARWLLRLVDLVLLVSLLEVVWLLWRGPVGQRASLLHNLLAGVWLTLALRLGLSGAGLWGVAPCLAAAGLAHGLDLRSRLQARPGPQTPPFHDPSMSTSAGTRP